jgi:hypothetical protein
MPRKITVIMPYYENRGMLRQQLRHYDGLSSAFRDNIAVIIVDDGSQQAVARVGGWDGARPWLRIFRIDEDIRWNQDAARNIGVSEAQTDWVILTDIDHIVSAEALYATIHGTMQRGAAYRFTRVTALDLNGTVEPYKPHPNSFFMERETFDKAGGYDERMAGWYGSDADFVERLAKSAPLLCLKEPLIRYPREVIADASTTTYLRKTEEDRLNIRRVKAERKALGEWRPLRYTNPWRQVYP